MTTINKKSKKATKNEKKLKKPDTSPLRTQITSDILPERVSSSVASTSNKNLTSSVVVPVSEVENSSKTIQADKNLSSSVVVPVSEAENASKTIQTDKNLSSSVVVPVSEAENSSKTIQTDKNLSSSVVVPVSEVENSSKTIQTDKNLTSSVVVPVSEPENSSTLPITSSPSLVPQIPVQDAATHNLTETFVVLNGIDKKELEKLKKSIGDLQQEIIILKQKNTFLNQENKLLNELNSHLENYQNSLSEINNNLSLNTTSENIHKILNQFKLLTEILNSNQSSYQGLKNKLPQSIKNIGSTFMSNIRNFLNSSNIPGELEQKLEKISKEKSDLTETIKKMNDAIESAYQNLHIKIDEIDTSLGQVTSNYAQIIAEKFKDMPVPIEFSEIFSLIHQERETIRALKSKQAGESSWITDEDTFKQIA